MTSSPSVASIGAKIASLSAWIDHAGVGRDPEAATWGRLAKITEEAGEVVAAFIGATGQNPRKGFTHTLSDVESELVDVAITALSALEHLRGNQGDSVDLLAAQINALVERAGISQFSGDAESAPL